MSIEINSQKFRVGDRVEMHYCGQLVLGTVFSIDSEDSMTVKRDDGNNGTGNYIDGHGFGWEVNKRNYYSIKNLTKTSDEKIISGSKNTMENLKEKFALALTKEPYKSFRKAGITNGDNILTDDGMKVFLTYLLEKHAEEFKKDVVDGLLEEEKD